MFYNYLPLVQQSELSEEDTFQLKKYEQAFSEENTNLFFTIRDETDTTLLTNYNGQNYATIKTYHFDRDSYEYNGSTASHSPMTEAEYENQAGKTYTVTCYVKDPITAQDNYYTPYKTSQALIFVPVPDYRRCCRSVGSAGTGRLHIPYERSRL